MTAGVVKLDGAADDGRLRLAAFSEVVEALQALLALMPAFGVDDPPAAIAHRIFGGGAAPSPSPARRPSPGGGTLGASARTLRNSRSTPSLRGGDAGAETPRRDPLASPALQQAMSLPVFRPAGPGGGKKVRRQLPASGGLSVVSLSSSALPERLDTPPSTAVPAPPPRAGSPLRASSGGIASPTPPRIREGSEEARAEASLIQRRALVSARTPHADGIVVGGGAGGLAASASTGSLRLPPLREGAGRDATPARGGSAATPAQAVATPGSATVVAPAATPGGGGARGGLLSAAVELLASAATERALVDALLGPVQRRLEAHPALAGGAPQLLLFLLPRSVAASVHVGGGDAAPPLLPAGDGRWQRPPPSTSGLLGRALSLRCAVRCDVAEQSAHYSEGDEGGYFGRNSLVVLPLLASSSTADSGALGVLAVRAAPHLLADVPPALADELNALAPALTTALQRLRTAEELETARAALGRRADGAPAVAASAAPPRYTEMSLSDAPPSPDAAPTAAIALSAPRRLAEAAAVAGGAGEPAAAAAVVLAARSHFAPLAAAPPPMSTADGAAAPGRRAHRACAAVARASARSLGAWR